MGTSGDSAGRFAASRPARDLRLFCAAWFAAGDCGLGGQGPSRINVSMIFGRSTASSNEEAGTFVDSGCNTWFKRDWE